MLNCAVLPDDEGHKQILLWGGSDDLHAVARGFRAFALQPQTGPIEGLPPTIRVVLGAPATGLTDCGDHLVWSLSPLDAERFALQAEALANSDRPGHHYLDTENLGTFGLEVKLSIGEYPADFRS